jgi:hypothetical protein
VQSLANVPLFVRQAIAAASPSTTVSASIPLPFNKRDKDKVAAHHDALEFPDGRIVLLTLLCEGQQATVLQLPAEPKTDTEAKAQQRAAYIG